MEGPTIKQERREPPSLRAFRGETRRTVAGGREVAKMTEQFLAADGLTALNGLRASVKRLTNDIKVANENGKVQRYRDLQAQLAESDKVKTALTTMLRDKGVDATAIQVYLKSSVFKEERLYGATREHLLRENHLLRSQLEAASISEKTSWGSTRAGGPEIDDEMATGARPTGSRRTKPLAGQHMEQLERFWQQLEALEIAENNYQLPVSTSVACEADDGSLKEIQILRSQASILAAQKNNLLLRVNELQELNNVVGKRLEMSLDETAEMKRQKMDLMEHRKDITAEVRKAMEAESKRADVAETEGREWRDRDQKNAKDLQAAARSLAAMETALEEKMAQLEELRALFKALLLRVGEQQETNGQAILAAVASQSSAVTEAKAAAREAAAKAAELAARQQVLEERTGQAIQALDKERQERSCDSKKAAASFLLTRMKDRQQEKTVQILAKDLPAAVSEMMSARMDNLQCAVDDVASRVKLANSQLSYASESTFKRGPERDQQDHTSQVLLESRKLRAHLEALSPLDGMGALASAARTRNVDETVGRAVLGSLGDDVPPITSQVASKIGSESQRILDDHQTRRV